MKIKRIISAQTGGTLIVALATAGILGTVLGTYMVMTSQGNLKVKRSIGWNAALPMAEAGIEEGCSQITQNTNIYLSDSWTFDTNAWAYNKKRFLGDGYYSVNINGWPGGVVAITSTGYGHWAGGSNYITRTVQVTAQTPTPYFPAGLIANTISFGGTFSADSFDSSTNRYSTAGQYDPKKATDHALVATPPGSTGYAISGTVNIYGYVATGAGGIVTISGSGVVGDFGYRTKGTIQPGHQTNSFTATFPPVGAPFGPNTPGVKMPTSGTNAGIAYTYVLNGGFYYASNLTAGSKMFVGATTTLIVAGGTDLPLVTFNPTNAPRLNIVYGGASINMSAPVTTVNGSPPQYWLYALPSCTTMKITGGTFIGVIYAPGMDLSAQGNASVQGAIVAKSFSCQGNFSFDYDDATAGTAPKPFQILTWAEL